MSNTYGSMNNYEKNALQFKDKEKPATANSFS